MWRDPNKMSYIDVMSKILIIGKSKQVLSELSSALIGEGFKVDTTSDLANLKTIDVANFDIIAFGRALSDRQKDELEVIYNKQNPNLSFVRGLAPITPLLVAQVEAAITDKKPDKLLSGVAYNRGQNQLVLNAAAKTNVSIRAWWLTWLFRAKNQSITKQSLVPGQQTIDVPVELAGKKSFLVLELDNGEFYVVY